jgi:E3 ubiquitin-protein ligase SHPRH
LDHLILAEQDTDQVINNIKTALAEHHVKGEALKTEERALRESRQQDFPETDKGKGKQAMSPFSDEEEDIDDLEDRDLPRNSAGKEHSMKRRALQQCPRECLMVLHRAKFLQGEIYHVLGASQSDKEDASYAAAETLRKDLLKGTRFHQLALHSH